MVVTLVHAPIYKGGPNSTYILTKLLNFHLHTDPVSSYIWPTVMFQSDGTPLLQLRIQVKVDSGTFKLPVS